jgi:hypothetical protein
VLIEDTLYWMQNGLWSYWNGELNAKRLLESEVTGYKVTGMNNRMYITLDIGLLAADAYNGSPLWERDIPHFRRIKISRDAGTEDEIWKQKKRYLTQLGFLEPSWVKVYNHCVGAVCICNSCWRTVSVC